MLSFLEFFVVLVVCLSIKRSVQRFGVEILIKVVNLVFVDLIQFLSFQIFCSLGGRAKTIDTVGLIIVIARAEELHGHKAVAASLVSVAVPLDVHFLRLLNQ